MFIANTIRLAILVTKILKRPRLPLKIYAKVSPKNRTVAIRNNRTNILTLFCFGLFALIETNIIRQNKQKNISIVACAISRLVIFVYFSPRRLILFFTLYLNWWIMLVFLFLYKITVFSSKGKFINSATSNLTFLSEIQTFPHCHPQ